jgi:hypothetical protein
MLKIAIVSLLSLTVACRPPLKTSKLSKLTDTIQILKNCSIPYMVTSDSLFSFVQITTSQRGMKLGFPLKIYSDSLLKANFYNSNPKYLQDSFVKACQRYLFERLGEQLYCNNLYMTMNSFGIDKGYKMDRRNLTFYFLMPTIISKKAEPWTGMQLEHTQFLFSLNISNPDFPVFIFPENVPDCNGSSDCGYRINRDSAILIAKRNNLLSDTTKFALTADGIYWRMSIDDYVLDTSRKIKINIQTGEIKQEISYPANDVMER